MVFQDALTLLEQCEEYELCEKVNNYLLAIK